VVPRSFMFMSETQKPKTFAKFRLAPKECRSKSPAQKEESLLQHDTNANKRKTKQKQDIGLVVLVAIRI